MRRWWWIGALLIALGPVRPAHAQQLIVPAGELDDYYRLLELTGAVSGMPLVFHSPSSMRMAAPLDTVGPWPAALGLKSRTDGTPLSRASTLPIDFRTVFNSRYPSGINDGALWAGRGLSGEVSGGGTLRIGAFTATLYPTLWFTQNRDFDIIPVDTPGYSPLGNPWHTPGIDWPQRFGTRAFASLDPGQSGVRLDASWFTVGLSTENAVWGPAFRNPIVLSATAPGFPHLDVGTGRAIGTPVGRLETRLMWGRLSESGYFDTDANNNARLFTGFTLAVEPRWLRGLTLGMTRVLYTNWDDSLRVVDFVDVFQPFFKSELATSADPEGNDDRDQLLSLIARWVLPESGFEAYVEWARNDHNINLRDFLSEPDHSQAWTLGFQKSLGDDGTRSLLRGEWTHLERSVTDRVRPTPSYYVHHLVLQGYTQRGQLLGAGIGPGSDSQHLGFDRYTRTGRWGGFVQRVGLDNDAYYALFAPDLLYEGHDVEVTAGISALRFVGNLEIGGVLSISQELNRHYQVHHDATNLNLQFSLRWKP